MKDLTVETQRMLRQRAKNKTNKFATESTEKIKVKNESGGSTPRAVCRGAVPVP